MIQLFVIVFILYYSRKQEPAIVKLIMLIMGQSSSNNVLADHRMIQQYLKDI